MPEKQFYVLTISMFGPEFIVDMEEKYGEDWEEQGYEQEYQEYDDVEVFVSAIYTDSQEELDTLVKERANYWGVEPDHISITALKPE